MMVRTISEAKAHLSSLVEQVLSGEEVVIGRAGKPVVRLVPYEGGVERRPGLLRGQIQIAPDFDELSVEVAAAFELDRP